MIRRYAKALCASVALAPVASTMMLAQSFEDYDAPAAYGADAGNYDASYDASYDSAYDSSYDSGSSYDDGYGAQNFDRRGFLGREVLGHGRLTNNDLLGDGKDRWQTGSVASSRVVGRGGWTGMLPDRPFDVLEYRLAVQVIAPENMRKPKANDRPWAGALTVGVHTHFARGPVELSMGADLSATGPQTGLSDFQTAVHDLMGVDPASKSVLSNQVENGFHPTVVLEAGNSVAVGGQAVLRPFAEARAGLETMVRVGADLTLGTVGQGELLVRDAVTGQRYRAVSNPLAGFSYVLGGDMAYVDSSALLPDDQVEATDMRNRLRAGVHWQGERNAAFYGVTWMSKEFEGQGSGQTVGSVRLDFKF